MANGRFGDNLQSPEYWAERAEYLAEEQYKGLAPVEKELQKAYVGALGNVKRTLADAYARYGADNKLSHADAQKLVQGFDLTEYGQRMAALQRNASSPYAQAEMEKLVSLMTLTRQQALNNEIEAILSLLAQEEVEIVTEHLGATYEALYYATAFEVSKGIGVGINFTQIDEAAVKMAISYPWSGDMFSDRIWTNKALLLQQLRSEITNGLIQGSSVQTMSRNLNNSMDTTYKNALRIVRTETSHVMNEATAEAYNKSEVVQQYVFLATLDSKTSGVCGRLDNKVFDLKERKVGTNYPPMHPNCRSAVAPYFADQDLSNVKRIAKLDGETDYVPANMSYEDWAKKYLK